MSKKLCLVVTHHNEDLATCKCLFDSIALQQGINPTDISVIISQDGEYDLTEIKEYLKDFPFEVSLVEQKQKGVSAARNHGLDACDSDYLMFCDCDDMFVSNYGLHLVFSAIQENPDVIVNAFVEEAKDSDGNYKLIRHDNDVTFVHGKCYKRSYLVEQDIRFNEELTVHEDCYFNTIAVTCADTRRTIETPYYLWKWNDKSTVRLDTKDYVLRTYPELMKVRTYMARELERRGYINEFIDCVVKTVFDSYYDFNKESYLSEENKHNVKRAKHAFKKFYEEFHQTYKDAAIQRKAELAVSGRVNAYQNGLVMESFTIKEFLNEIVNEVK